MDSNNYERDGGRTTAGAPSSSSPAAAMLSLHSSSVAGSSSASPGKRWGAYFADPAAAHAAIVTTMSARQNCHTNHNNSNNGVEDEDARSATESSDWNEAIRMASSQTGIPTTTTTTSAVAAGESRSVASRNIEDDVPRRLTTIPSYRETSLPHNNSHNHNESYRPQSSETSNQKKDSGNDMEIGNATENDNSNKDNNDHDDEDPLPTYQYSSRSSWHWASLDDIRRLRLWAGQVVNHSYVQLGVVVLIAVNAIMMGIATFPFVKDDPVVSNAFDVTDTAILVVFTIELALQFLFHGWRLLLDGWLVFDLVIVVMSWSFDSVQIIRAFRIFRALRLVTRIKVMKNLILALFSVVPRMFAIGLLLFLVSYIFAVLCTQLFSGLYPTYTDINYWGRLDATFFSLFQIMTLDNWADIARTTMVAYPYAWLPIVVFVIVTGFVVVNLIIAVICDAISALHDDDKAKLHGNYTEDGGGDSGTFQKKNNKKKKNSPKNRTATTNASTEEEDNDDAAVVEGDGDDTSSSSDQHPALREDVRDQLRALELHVEELTRAQEETLRALQELTSRLAERRSRRRQQQHQQRRKSHHRQTTPRGVAAG